MKTYNTHIAVVLDRSGSMESLKNEIVGGFNAFLADQKTVPGAATLTLVQFDNEIDRLTTFRPIAEVPDLTDKTYQPRGCTRLYDAIGLTVNTTAEDIAKAAEKPDKVLVVILTDGQENSSQEYTTESIKTLLEAKQKDGWEFTFIGANQDAILTARGIGLSNAASNITFAATPDGADNIMRSLSSNVRSYRCADAGVAYSYSQADRDAQSIDPSVSAHVSVKATFNEHGSKAGVAGGAARAAALSPRQRSMAARNAAKARWSRNSV